MVKHIIKLINIFKGKPKPKTKPKKEVALFNREFPKFMEELGVVFNKWGVLGGILNIENKEISTNVCIVPDLKVRLMLNNALKVEKEILKRMNDKEVESKLGNLSGFGKKQETPTYFG